MIACYVRVSTDDQNTDLQVNAIKKYLEFKGQHEAASFFIDKESGAKTSRPEFDKMMSACRKGEFKQVIVWKLDRLGRSTVHLISVVEELKQLDIDFISLTENLDTASPMGKMIFTIFAALAEFERETIIMRTRAGMKAAKERGTHCGRKPKVTKQQAEEVVYLRDNAMGLDQICQVMPGLSRSTIYRIMKGKSYE